MFRGVDGPLGAGLVQQRETAPDHRVGDFAHRHRPRHRTRPAQPQQLVGAGEFVDGGAAVDPRDVVPQRQRLGVAQHLAEPPPHHQPLAEWPAVALHRLGGVTRRGDDRPFGQQVPRTLAGLRVRRVFVVHRELVAHSSFGDQLAAAVGQRRHRAAAGRIDP
jgi:hypothetical protein